MLQQTTYFEWTWHVLGHSLLFVCTDRVAQKGQRQKFEMPRVLFPYSENHDLVSLAGTC